MKQQFKLVPRKEGDAPIPPEIEQALRTQGIDPTKFSLAATSSGELATLLSAMPASGQRLRHTFRFATLDAAFSAIERLIDDDMPVTITKVKDGYLVVFDRADDAAADDAGEHRAFSDRVTALGGEDRGYIRETVARRISNVTKP